MNNPHKNIYKALPQIPIDDLYFLWFEGWWDGALSGKATYNGQMVHFELVHDEGLLDDDNDLWGVRHYTLHPLTEEQAEMSRHRHELFEQYVGTHTRWFTRIPREEAVMQPRVEWDKFYEGEGGVPIGYKASEIPPIGWFEV